MTNGRKFNPSLDTPRIPDDAGLYATCLGKILSRIPNGWGRWISCGPGWYPIIVKLDRDLAAYCPEYEVHQVKEKFGALRYYFGLPDETPVCCLRAKKDQEKILGPRPLWDQGSNPQYQVWIDAHEQYWETHHNTAEHQATEPTEAEIKNRKEMYHNMYKLTDVAEKESTQTCELTGAPGVLMRNGTDTWGWLKTLDPCTSPPEYVRIVNQCIEDADAEIEQIGDDVDKLKSALREQISLAQTMTTIAQKLLDARLEKLDHLKDGDVTTGQQREGILASDTNLDGTERTKEKL